MSESASEKKALQRKMASIVARAETGDPAGVSALTEMLREHPDWVEAHADLARHAENAFLEFVSANAAVEVVVRQQLAQMRKDLEDQLTTPLERLLIAQVVMSWSWANFADRRMALVLQEGTTLTKAKLYDGMQERAARRHVAAVKALVQVRRLLVPRSGRDIASRASRPSRAPNRAPSTESTAAGNAAAGRV